MNKTEHPLHDFDFTIDPDESKYVEKLLSFISTGQSLNFEGFEKKELNVKWISYLLCDQQASARLSRKGLTINHATIKGKLDMEGLALDLCIDFDDCTFEEEVNFNSAKIGSLTFQKAILKNGLTLISAEIGGQLNCRGAILGNNQKGTSALVAQNAIIQGSVLLDQYEDNDDIAHNRRFVAKGDVDIQGIRIGGLLSCSGGLFVNIGKDCISAQNAVISGDVIFSKKSSCIGEVNLQGANISGTLYFCGKKIINSNGWAINAKRIKVGGDVLFADGFMAKGEVKFCGAQIGGQLKCEGSKFNKPDKDFGDNAAFVAKGLRINGPVFMNNEFTANGIVKLTNARIEGNLDCTGGEFYNKCGTAIDLQRAKIDGDVFLSDTPVNNQVRESDENKRFRAIGEVNLCGANINGQLNCKNGLFNNDKNNCDNIKEEIFAIKAIGLAINGPLFMSEGFEAIGGVDLLNAKIAATVYCCGGKFIANKKLAINAERITVGGDWILHHNDYYYDDKKDKKLVVNGNINLKKANIAQGFIFHGCVESENFKLILENARIDTIDDRMEVWKSLQNINLHGCIYESIAYNSPYKCSERKIWLAKQPPADDFTPQPYRQLAKVLDEMGYESEAREVRIEMNDRLRRKKKTVENENAEDKHKKTFSKLYNIIRTRKRQLWLRIAKLLFGYGYKPFRVLNWALLILIIGAVIFWLSYNNGLLKRVKPANETKAQTDSMITENQPKFSPVFYSLDVFLPIGNLQQADNWHPKYKISRAQGDQGKLISYIGDWSYWLTLWMYFQILSGWLLVTLLIGGLSGLIRER